MAHDLSVNYNYLFPSLVVYRDDPNLITKEIVEESELFLSQCGEKPFHSPCISTVNSSIDVLSVPIFKNISNFVYSVVDAYISLYSIDPSGLKFKGSWLNLYDVHSYQDLHHHHSSVIS